MNRDIRQVYSMRNESSIDLKSISDFLNITRRSSANYWDSLKTRKPEIYILDNSERPTGDLLSKIFLYQEYGTF